MENEVKVETKKKGNGLFTLFACIMTGVIVFLATNIGQKASKTVDPDTPKKNEVTSNVESNPTSNVVDTTVTDAEKTQVNEILGLLFNSKTIDKSNLFDSAYVNFNIFNNFTAKNGKYYVTVGGIGFMGDCTTTLTVKSITATKIVFNAKTKIVYPTGYGEPNSTENHDFIIVKENGTWKISKYTYIIANTLK